MAYNNMPFGHDMNGQSFYGGNMSNSQVYRQDDLMEIENSWIENIDPLLRQAQSQDPNPSWQQQQRLQKWMTEPERAFFTAGPLPTRPQGLPRGLMRPNEGVPALYKAPRMTSPSPSQELSSVSSARSPGAELDLYPDTYYSPQDEYSLPNYMSHFSQGLPDLWQGAPFTNRSSGNSFVNLNEIQGFADDQDGHFETEEGYPEMDLHTIEVDHHHLKSQGHTSYRHTPSDEGLGASIKSANSPANSTQIDDAITDADAEAEIDDELLVPEDPISDTEYTPKSTRTRKRRASKPTSPPANKRRAVSKPSKAKSTLPYTCKTCNHIPFKDAAALQRHINTTHTRAFICVFGFAGCESTFTSKNEWKRHVASQHLNLNSWVCELGACGKAQHARRGENGVTIKGAEFNRKDLFTQHLRRMHAPFDVKRKGKKNGDWEEKLKELQVSCLRVKRLPPLRLACPVGGCEAKGFEGSGCWDERMEHVGKHLEKAAAEKREIRQEDDGLLVDWAIRERIVERTARGEYRLAGAWFDKPEEGEEDADGEDDLDQ